MPPTKEKVVTTEPGSCRHLYQRNVPKILREQYCDVCEDLSSKSRALLTEQVKLGLIKTVGVCKRITEPDAIASRDRRIALEIDSRRSSRSQQAAKARAEAVAELSKSTHPIGKMENEKKPATGRIRVSRCSCSNKAIICRLAEEGGAAPPPCCMYTGGTSTAAVSKVGSAASSFMDGACKMLAPDHTELAQNLGIAKSVAKRGAPTKQSAVSTPASAKKQKQRSRRITPSPAAAAAAGTTARARPTGDRRRNADAARLVMDEADAETTRLAEEIGLSTKDARIAEKRRKLVFDLGAELIKH